MPRKPFCAHLLCSAWVPWGGCHRMGPFLRTCTERALGLWASWSGGRQYTGGLHLPITRGSLVIGPCLQELWLRWGQCLQFLGLPRPAGAFEVSGSVSLTGWLSRRTLSRLGCVPIACSVSPSVSLSLPFHICAYKIYWCLCSRTASDSSLLWWGPISQGCGGPGHSHPEPRGLLREEGW